MLAFANLRLVNQLRRGDPSWPGERNVQFARNEIAICRISPAKGGRHTGTCKRSPAVNSRLSLRESRAAFAERKATIDATIPAEQAAAWEWSALRAFS